MRNIRCHVKRRRSLRPHLDVLENRFCFAADGVINFDNLTAVPFPPGPVITNQYPEATFSSDPGDTIVPYEFAPYATSPPNFATTAHNGTITNQQNIYIDFTQPVNNLTLNAIGVNNFGIVAQINVFAGGKESTVSLLGLGNYAAPVPIDLSTFRNVTRIEIVKNTDPAGFGLDDIKFHPSIVITSVNKQTFIATDTTFIATDTVVVQADVKGAPPGSQVLWTVEGKGAAANISGFPTNVATSIDSAGTSSFSFRPSDDPNLVTDRHTAWTKGSTTPNPAMSFEIAAKIILDNKEYSSKLSQTKFGILTQDETDILREEYYDWNQPVPARDQFVASLGPRYNFGNYNIQLNVDMPNHYAAILAAYRGQQVTFTIGGQKYTATIPDTATITINSAYRSPQHNKAAKSTHPDSRHTLGRAFDLKPDPFDVVIMVNGRPMRFMVPLHQSLYPALYRAAVTQGFAQAEARQGRVDVGTIGEDHIHVEW